MRRIMPNSDDRFASLWHRTAYQSWVEIVLSRILLEGFADKVAHHLTWWRKIFNYKMLVIPEWPNRGAVHWIDGETYVNYLSCADCASGEVYLVARRYAGKWTPERRISAVGTIKQYNKHKGDE